ncbi:TonB-dependent hemoglobin/transferrin/lactoferrin family receptor [Sneathiella aquimaris]|uniref:TonB-dependent hemoglobin/transferrin/lactoferrin family receptor n=1 Tax=Sneathiella aquimaris TaxID=2599305 RepID=UPI00146AD573|nr:TonB-dependent hemoglobin/transferrin/lactoferrin family receptor [Sneathiella aquimaris]
MRGSLRVVIKAALLSTTILTPAMAEEVQPNTELDAVTVYATRSPQSTFNVPSMVGTVDLEDAGNATSGNLNDILKHQVGVEVGGGPRSSSQTVRIRGYSDDAVITLIDGRRQQFQSGHDGRQFIDGSLLKSVEIVRGSSSSIYGGGGIGGVIAFKTKEAADLLSPGENFGVSNSILFRTANNNFTPNVTAYGRTEMLDVVGSLSYRRSGDVELGTGEELATKERILNGLLKAGLTFADYHTVNLEGVYFKNDGEEPNNSNSTGVAVKKDISDYQFSLKYAFEDPANDLVNPKLHLYFNRTQTDEEDITGANAGRVRSRDFRTLAFTADNQSRLSVSKNQTHTFSYGAEFYRDTLDPSSTTGTFDGVPDASSRTYGVYIQDEISFDTDAGKFLIIPALRYDHYSSDDANGNSQSEGAFSPKLAVSYRPIPSFMVFSSLARAFRAPNLTETYATGLHFPGGGPIPNNFFVPNPDLKPEVVTTFEIGAGIDLQNVLSETDKLQIKGSAYQSWGKDFIALNVDAFGGTTENTNIPDAVLFGWEVETAYQSGPLGAKVGLSYIEAENDNTGEYLGNSTPITLITDLNYTATSLDSVFGWRGRFSDANDKVGNNDTPTDGYAVHDLYYRWAPTDGQFQDVMVDFSISNLFDAEYKRIGSSVEEEGRSFNAKVTYKW